MPTLSDPLGLHTTEVLDMPVVGATADMARLAQTKTCLALTGSRHSQGGQTLATDARVLLTEPMSRLLAIGQTSSGMVCQVEAGMTWNALHAHLAPEGCAPLVQQSSPHFTVGGSISVNCHGRDPRQGPLATCIEEMTVYRPSVDQTVAVGPGDPLFKAVVGGYGSAGVILTATLRVGPNLHLRQRCKTVSLSQYAQDLRQQHASGKWPQLHYGWLSFDPARLFEEVLAVDCVAPPESQTPARQPAQHLREDGWGSVELMRAIWEQHQNDPMGRAATWRLLCHWFLNQNGENAGQGLTKTTTDWLRQPIGFTAHRSQDSVELLQEYFVPMDQLEPFALALADLLKRHAVNVLSSTVRVVQPDQAPGAGSDPLTFLSYAPDEAMACVALDFQCPLSNKTKADCLPKPAVYAWVQEAIALALKHKGRYYLPYFGFAKVAQFQRAYPQWPSQQFHRDPRLDNYFIQDYLQ